MSHRVSWWQRASPLRALVAPRIPFTARIGVGAVQNRRRYHRVISTVCGDAGRPAHQRPETPRCARRHHDRFAPVCGTAMRRFPPVCGPTARRFAPVCGPTTRRFAPRYPPTSQNPTLRDVPPTIASHPDDPTLTADSHPDTHQRPKPPRRATHHRRSLPTPHPHQPPLPTPSHHTAKKEAPGSSPGASFSSRYRVITSMAAHLSCWTTCSMLAKVSLSTFLSLPSAFLSAAMFFLSGVAMATSNAGSHLGAFSAPANA
jgi:hypothetical protein